MRRMWWYIGGLSFVGAAGAGCAALEQPSPVAASAKAPAAVDVTGKWEGSWSTSAGSGGLLFSLQQQGSSVSGTIDMYTALAAAFFGGERPIRDGRVSGDRFFFAAEGSGGSLNAGPLVLKGNKMEGPFIYRGLSFNCSLVRRE